MSFCVGVPKEIKPLEGRFAGTAGHRVCAAGARSHRCSLGAWSPIYRSIGAGALRLPAQALTMRPPTWGKGWCIFAWPIGAVWRSATRALCAAI